MPHTVSILLEIYVGIFAEVDRPDVETDDMQELQTWLIQYTMQRIADGEI